jgi:PUA domain protein
LKRWVSSRHDSMDLIEKLTTSLGVKLDLSRSAQVLNAEPEEGARFLIIDDNYTFIAVGDEFIPFIGSVALLSMFPSARVDEGALKFLVNGADVMRPGVISHDDWGPAGRIIVVRDQRKGRGIAVGKAMLDSKEMAEKAKGPCIKSLHHVGDKYWNLYKQI